MTNPADTIVAVATPPGEGGVGVVRLSGPRAKEIGVALVETTSAAGARWPSHRLVYGHVVDEVTGRAVDEVLAVFMRGPHTYTAEDVFEVQCHGGPVVLRRIVALALRQGARLAERGEFTLRAFLNGRLDLAQAEAVLDVVKARTPGALQVAVDQLDGALSRRLSPLEDDLLGVLAFVEASIDFVEDGIPASDSAVLLARIDAVGGALASLRATAREGMVLRGGVRAVLAGAPNVGKSSLLNALLDLDRAIVTPVAGTTRDTVEEPAVIGGLPVYLVDTAGLTPTDDPVEKLGVERSRQAIAGAGLLLLVADLSRPLDAQDRAALSTARALAPATPAVLVLNKADLPPQLDLTTLDDLWDGRQPVAVVRCAALTGTGLDDLRDAIAVGVLGDRGGQREDPDRVVIDNERHYRALEEAAEALSAARDGLEAAAPLDLAAGDLRAAATALGRITGRDVGDDLLSRIFADFCIGK